MRLEIELTEEHKIILKEILYKQYSDYKDIFIIQDNIIHLYKNYKPYNGWEDYKLNYDDHMKIHWYEFMIRHIIFGHGEEADNRYENYINLIFIMEDHPIDAYVSVMKNENGNKE